MMNRIQKASWRLAAASGSPIARLRRTTPDDQTCRAAYLDQLQIEWKRRLDTRG